MIGFDWSLMGGLMSLLIEKTFDGTAVRLNYAEGPPGGPPLLLLHGFGDRWQGWLDLISTLVLRWHVFAIDHRGHGKSGRSKDGYGTTSYPSDAAEFLQAKVGDPAVVIGHSLGARTAMLVGADRPDLVRALVLEDPPMHPIAPGALRGVGTRFTEEAELVRGEPALDRMIAGMKRIYPESDDAEIRDRARKRSLLDPAVYDRVVGGGHSDVPDTESALKRIQAPTLLVHGDPELGGIVTEDEAAWAVGLVPGLTAVRIEGVGHGIHRGRPVEFKRVITDFLESL